LLPPDALFAPIVRFRLAKRPLAGVAYDRNGSTPEVQPAHRQ